MGNSLLSHSRYLFIVLLVTVPSWFTQDLPSPNPLSATCYFQVLPLLSWFGGCGVTQATLEHWYRQYLSKAMLAAYWPPCQAMLSAVHNIQQSQAAMQQQIKKIVRQQRATGRGHGVGWPSSPRAMASPPFLLIFLLFAVLCLLSLPALLCRPFSLLPPSWRATSCAASICSCWARAKTRWR